MSPARSPAIVVDAASWAGDAAFVTAVHHLLASLVRDGAALGWLDPPASAEIGELLASLAGRAVLGDAAICAAYAALDQSPAAPPPALDHSSPAAPPLALDHSSPAAPPPALHHPPATPPPATQLIGFGYWARYERPTHRPHADIRRIAVARHAQGRGVGRQVTQALIDSARQTGIEVVTLDARGDNANALHLYRSLGFTEYGRLKDFVAVGDRRYDTVFCALDLRARSALPLPAEGPFTQT